jgi:transcriptional regulator with XRE-family HTH domain
MSTSGSPTVRRRRLAAELRRLREQSDQTAEAVGKILGWSKAKVSRYELARGGLKPSDVKSLLDGYRVQGERHEQLLTLAEEATQEGWWEAYADVQTEEQLTFVGLEAEATSVLQWQINVVPGLLQTEQYAREIFLGYQVISRTAPAITERRVQTRMIRQQVLTRDKPLDLAVVIDESVLHRQRGDRAVMHEQLQHLAEVSTRPSVTLRILPFAGPKGLALDSFQILKFGRAHETPLHDVVSAESLINYLYVEGETDTYGFALAFEHLAQESLEPEESRELILRTARQLWALSAGLGLWSVIALEAQ